MESPKVCFVYAVRDDNDDDEEEEEEDLWMVLSSCLF